MPDQKIDNEQLCWHLMIATQKKLKDDDEPTCHCLL